MPDMTPSKVVVEPVEEVDEDVQKLANTSGAGLLALIAPHYPERLSPKYSAFASVGVQEEFGVESFIDICAGKGIKSLYCLVSSPGGLVTSSFKVARALAEAFETVTMFVPHVAASGGTMIALAGNEIVMGRMSNLTPVDVQVAYKGSRVSSNSIVRAFERFSAAFESMKMSEDEAPYTIKSMSDKIDPIVMEEMVGENSTCASYIARILEDAGVEQKLAAKQARFLTTGFRSHSTVLHRDALLAEEFRVVPDTKYPHEWRIMRKWFRKYIGQSGLIHTMTYCVPQAMPATKATPEKQEVPSANGDGQVQLAEAGVTT